MYIFSRCLLVFSDVQWMFICLNTFFVQVFNISRFHLYSPVYLTLVRFSPLVIFLSAVLLWQVRNQYHFTVARFVACYILPFSLKLFTEKLSHKYQWPIYYSRIFNSFNLMFLNIIFINPHMLMFLALIFLRWLMLCCISTVRLLSCFPWSDC